MHKVVKVKTCLFYDTYNREHEHEPVQTQHLLITDTTVLEMTGLHYHKSVTSRVVQVLE